MVSAFVRGQKQALILNPRIPIFVEGCLFFMLAMYMFLAALRDERLVFNFASVRRFGQDIPVWLLFIRDGTAFFVM